MTKRKWVLVSVLILVIIIGLVQLISTTGWGGSVLFPVSEVSREIMTPLQKGIDSAVLNVRNFFGYFQDNRTLRQENEELKKALAQKEEEIYQLREQELENKRLHSLLDYQAEKEANYEMTLARVIGRDPSNWYKSIIIDKGRKSGLRINMPVITHQGLVGTIINVTDNSAEVLLILNGDGAVGAQISENRTPAVVIGNSRTETLQMIHLPHDVDIKPGQTISTSGLGVLYPKGIRIGYVLEVKTNPNGLTQTATIRPYVDFNRLEEVMVILQVKSLEGTERMEVVPADTNIPTKPLEEVDLP